jgi:hypothetical protein
VTSILSGVFGFDDYYTRWSVKVGVEAALAAQEDARAQGRELSETELVLVAENARHILRDNAGAKGTIVHSWTETTLKGHEPMIDPRYEPYYRAFLRFLADHKVAPIFQERKVWNEVWEYAGRLDCYAYVTCLEGCHTKSKYYHEKFENTPVLLDFKTSNHLRWQYGLQLAAYRECLERLGYPVDAICAVHLRDSGRYTMKQYHNTFHEFTQIIPAFRVALQYENVQYTDASDEDAIAKEAATEVTAPVDGGLQKPPVPFTDANGFTPDEEALPPLQAPQSSSPTAEEIAEELMLAAARGIPPSQTAPQEPEPVPERGFRRRGRPRKHQQRETSVPLGESSRRTHMEEGVVVLPSSVRTPRIILDEA